MSQNATDGETGPAAATGRPRRASERAARRRRARLLVAAYVLGIVATLTAAEALRTLGDAAERPGLAAFYAAPAAAELTGAPGTIIRSEPLAGVPLASRGWRIMYRSTDLHGTPIAVTGIVVTPLRPVMGERTVLAWGHPTTGTSPDCAPSRSDDPFLGIEGLRLMLDRGYTVVATDYAGMGTEGPDSYLVGVTAAHSVLDGVRAAQAIEAAAAGDRVVLWGHSQGGQAVLFAAEQASAYAPELEIAAVAAAAPAADLTALMGSHLDDLSGVTIGSYAFAAYADVYGPTMPGAELDTVLTPEAIAQLPEMNRLCLLPELDRLHAIAEPLVGDFFAHDPTAIEPWAGLLEENSAGRTAIDVPLFVAQGADDRLVLPADTAEFVARERSLGVDVTETVVPGATHSTIAYLALPALDAWLDRVEQRASGG
ncbi:alpha/beta fold hydrolase [Agromyces sp. NPDC060279]|uniref:alpha/beta fold hydrolase n=1 Tax=Agromyces sp. NPDC060279 TaxID=3347092 RepID=UPI00364D131F